MSPDKFEPLLDLILGEVDRLLDGELSDDEIISGKDYRRGQFQLSPFIPESWAAYYRGHYLDREQLLPADYQSRLESASRDKVINLARQIFESGDWTLGVLGDLPKETRNRIEAKLNRRQTVDR